MEDRRESHIDREENREICRLFAGLGRWPDVPAVVHPDEDSVSLLGLGVHPDLIDRLWTELPILLPEDCRRIVYGVPALLHPASCVIFGFALGTHSYALRLPEEFEREALSSGAKKVYQYPNRAPMDLAVFGTGWVWCCWHADEPLWCLAGYERAGGAA